MLSKPSKRRKTKRFKRRRSKLMELELGLKITQTRDHLSSTADLRISKDAGGVLFFSRETEAMFVLTGHLRGYSRKHVGIRINEDGSQIAIRGEKPVQEKVIQGWIVYKSEVELKGFTKVFRIPQGVVLDKIKAKFNEDGSVLTISMPKSVKGISGEGIEEVKEAVDGDGESSEVRDEAEGGDIKRVQEEPSTSKVEDQPELVQKTSSEEYEEPVHEPVEGPDQAVDESDERQEPDEERSRDHGENDRKPQDKGPRKKFKICAPAAVAGSALLMTLIVLVKNLIKAKQR